MQIRKIISILLVSTILGYLFYSYLYYSQTGEFTQIFSNWVIFFYILATANFIGFTVFFANNILNKILFRHKRIGLKFLLGLLVNYGIILFTVYIFIFLYLRLSEDNNTLQTLLTNYPEVKVRLYILALVLDIFLEVFNLLNYSYRHYSYDQIQNARLKRKQIELQFEALRTQLSPHYLFNSLNTISSLIYKDIKQTEEYIRKLANTYQYILESDKKQLITLQEEIDFIKDYCFLLTIRFGKAFKVYMDVWNSCSELMIPPISIQILIENAVKHNVFDDDEPLEIDIITKDNLIYVKNKILRSPENRESFKIGLGNIRNRYEVFTDQEIRIIKKEFFTVELPLLKAEANG